MQYEANTHYNEALIKEAALVYWKKSCASTFIISIAGVALALVLMYFFNLRTWTTGVFLAISIISSIIFLAAFFVFRARSLAVYKNMKTLAVKWIINEQHMSVESEAGNNIIKWNMFKTIIKSDKFWLLVHENNSYSVFPIQGVSKEALNLMSKNILERNDKSS